MEIMSGPLAVLPLFVCCMARLAARRPDRLNL
jgi:hypothetical protein